MKKNGFTLIELSIVIVVIGLVIGAVMSGQELVIQSRYKAVEGRLRDYSAAYSLFFEKFKAMPGDISTAVEYNLCTNSAGSNNCAYTGTNTSAGIGNGNKDGLLTSSAQATAHYDGELANYWVHLSNGGFVKGGFSQVSNCQYAGAGNVANCKGVAGTNLPRSYFGTSIAAVYSKSGAQGALNYDPNGGLYYTLGSSLTNDIGYGIFGGYGGNNSIAGLTLTPSEAYYFDRKMDDGFPKTGAIQTFWGFGDVSATVASVTYSQFFYDSLGSASDCYSTISGVKTYNYATLTTKVCSIKMKVAE